MKSLIRLTYKLGYPLAKCWWFIRRPRTKGVRCIITHGDNVLLIRHTYGSNHWTVPGGGIKPGESPYEAVLREVQEEVGLQVPTATPLEQIYNTDEWKRDTTHFFTATTNQTEVHIDHTEIGEAQWFSLHKLPENTPQILLRFLQAAAEKQ
jgi:8-oxo-dGTP diphosphatase